MITCLLVNLLFLGLLLVAIGYAAQRGRVRCRYVQVTSGPGRPPTPTSLKDSNEESSRR